MLHHYHISGLDPQPQELPMVGNGTDSLILVLCSARPEKVSPRGSHIKIMAFCVCWSLGQKGRLLKACLGSQGVQSLAINLVTPCLRLEIEKKAGAGWWNITWHGQCPGFTLQN